MASCNDEKLGQLLHAWELGQLTEEETVPFEEHLYGCPHCFEQATQFTDFVLAIRHDAGVRDTIATFAELSEAESEAIPIFSRQRRWSGRIIIPLIATAALLLLIVQPWEIEFFPAKDAWAGAEQLAVAYLDDHSDSTGAGWMVVNLLITDLSETDAIDVLSRESVDDLLRPLPADPGKRLDRHEAIRLARDANVRWLLFGNTPDQTDSLLVNVELVDARTGTVISTNQASCSGPVSVFCVTDKLTKEVKNSLPIPDSVKSAYDPPVDQITTGSVEAYRLYIEGLDLYLTYYHAAAAEKFRAALEYDSTFALAWYYLSRVTTSSQVATGSERRRFSERAMQYLSRANWRDQQLIKAWHARVNGHPHDALAHLHKLLNRHPQEKSAVIDLAQTFKWSLGDWDSSIYYFNEALKCDSALKNVYNQLSWNYLQRNQFDKSLWAAHRYVELAPEEANPYSVLGDIYFQQGWDDSAINSFEKSLDIRPGFFEPLFSIGNIYAFQRKFPEARYWYEQMLVDPVDRWRSCGRLFLSQIPLNQGQWKRGLTELSGCIAADENDGYRGSLYIHKRVVRAFIYLEFGDTAAALAEMDTAVAQYRENDPLDNYPLVIQAWMFTECNQIDTAKYLASVIKNAANPELPNNCIAYKNAMGLISLATGDVDAACEYFTSARKHPLIWQTSQLCFTHIMEAKAYLLAGRYTESIELFESLIAKRWPTRPYWIIWFNRSYFWLAQAYEGAGRTHDAIREYQTFLDLFAGADFETEYMRHARHRVELLKK